jgi:hypothetical protein
MARRNWTVKVRVALVHLIHPTVEMEPSPKVQLIAEALAWLDAD